MNFHNILKALCFNSHWNYAVFWKLKHRARMVLTWEDAYYDNFEHHDPLENKRSRESQEHTCGGNFSHDPLGLAVAKMSYHVYSLGEGIVGQVAATGKHQWIFADNHFLNSFPSFEFSDGWQGQFLAGIRTVVVVAVVPYGVVQLGSLNKVIENMKLVEHIKEAFLALQDSSFAHATNALQYQMKSSLVQGSAVEMVNNHEAVELLTEGNDESELLQQRSNVSYLEDQNEIRMKLITDQMCGGDNTRLNGKSDDNLTPESNTKIKNTVSLGGTSLPGVKSGADHVNLPMNIVSTDSNRVNLDCMDMCQNGVLNEPESSDTNFRKYFEKLEYQSESSHYNMSNTFFKFSADSELHKALGPAFVRKSANSGGEAEENEAGVLDMLQDLSGSQITFGSGSESLLEAVVGSVYHGSSDIMSEQSVCKSVQSLFSYEKMLDPSSPSKHLVQTSGYSINQHSTVEGDSQNCSKSTDVCGAMSSRGHSSNCTSICSEQLDRHSEPSKNNKKRTKSGENPRPRPRDRQLIQDRIKELRELVPNGSKCSIDSLLERTIKYMCFLESITKHADKLNKCESKKGLVDSSYEQGSSWAVEVGGHLKVSSIIVENLNKNGQLIVEMLCEECSHFLEIADAIRSLGLTILKGITEMHGEKTWICFVVEGQNNMIMHRMDILWSLVQTLQPKTTS